MKSDIVLPEANNKKRLLIRKAHPTVIPPTSFNAGISINNTGITSAPTKNRINGLELIIFLNHIKK